MALVLFIRQVTPKLQKKDVSEEKAPASLKSSLVSTLYMRWGRALEYGAGLGTVVRRMTSRPAGGGKSIPDINFLSSGKLDFLGSSSNGPRVAA